MLNSKSSPRQFASSNLQSNRRISPNAQKSFSQKDNTRRTAIVYCEGNLGKVDGKTANGLVRSSEGFLVLAVIDSENAGLDAGEVIGEKKTGIPVVSNLAEALSISPTVPNNFLFGVAPADGKLNNRQRRIMLQAMRLGMNVVCGLHEFLSDDPEFAKAAIDHEVSIHDVRKPKAIKDLRLFTDNISQVECPRIAVLGTDCAIGKRTTATILTRALNQIGIRAIMVGTGQTGLMQGARYGVAVDAIPSQFCAGEIEATILEAVEAENPEVIIVEGQGALGHPAFSSSSFIIRGSKPNAVIMQHAPGRRKRCDFEHMEVPSLESEISLVELFGKTKVIGVAINDENLSKDELNKSIQSTIRDFGLPAVHPLQDSPLILADMVLTAFPSLVRTKPVGA